MSRLIVLALCLAAPLAVAHASTPTDSDDDGLYDLEELGLGTDPFDADSDGDGLPDGAEVEDPSDPSDQDGDGLIDALDDDDDDDGIPTEIELGDWDAAMLGLRLPDADRDGLPDHLDLDSDDDGHPDAIEGADDLDGDGKANHVDPDADGDGVYDVVERHGDTDGDGLPDVIDGDDDGDGIPTSWEKELVAPGDQDLDRDGDNTWVDEDSDGDGVSDLDEGVLDDDCDGRPNFIDGRDDDGPCISTFQPPPSMKNPGQSGCSTVNTSTGALALFMTLLVLGLRRRR